MQSGRLARAAAATFIPPPFASSSSARPYTFLAQSLLGREDVPQTRRRDEWRLRAVQAQRNGREAEEGNVQSAECWQRQPQGRALL